MSRSKKRRRKARAKKIKPKFQQCQETSEGPALFRHPFSDIPPDVLRCHLIQFAQDSEVVFKECLDEIQKILKEVDPLDLVSQLANYGLSAGISKDGKIVQNNKIKGFYQPHVELVQALALRLDFDELGSEYVTPEIVQRCFEILPKLSESFAAQRMVALDQERSEQQKAILLLQEHLRTHTQMVRNWGYADKVKRILSCLADYFSIEFVEQIGISATQILEIFQNLLERTERNINKQFGDLRQVFKQNTIEGMVQTYHELFECSREGESEFIKNLEDNAVPIQQLKYMLLTHSDLRLQKAYTFTSAEVADELKMPLESVKKLLEHISIPFGGLSEKQPDWLLLDNPVWTKPVLRTSNDHYFCALPMLLFGFSFHILNDIVVNYPKLKSVYHDGRAKFLEEEIDRLFREAFPGCEIKSSYKWCDQDKMYENDLLVRIDTHLFIVEAKSHSVSWPALRGAPDRIKRHIDETIIDPSEQSWRLADRIRQVLVNPKLQEELLPHFPLLLKGVRTVLRLSVTLEDFAVIQTNQHLLKRTGWIPDGHRLAPCMLLADMEIVFDTLDSVGQKIHYLRRRSELAEHMEILGDEIDFIGFYLKFCFNIGLTEHDGDSLCITGMSGVVDEYFTALAEGITRKKPELKLTNWWRNILQAIEERRFEGWTDMVCILLNCSYEEQLQAEKMFAGLRRSVQKTFRDPKHLSSVVMTPHKRRADALVLYAFKEIEMDRRYEMMQDISSQAFKYQHVQRCLVIGINIDRPIHPYSTLACFFRDDPSARTDFDVR